jgi:hypothetical protein
MKKLAIFVEGKTEQLFVEKLLFEIAGRHALEIVKFKATGGAQPGTRRLEVITAATAPAAPAPARKYYIMLVDCGTDNRVKSDIVDNYRSLAASGYSAIIGIRDVYPDASHAEIARLRTGLNTGLPTVPIVVSFILGIMEIESWFLSEFTHFERINPALTPARILAELGMDTQAHDMQLLPQPAVNLDSAYRIVGMRYDKTHRRITRTVEALSYEHFYLGLAARLPDLAALNAAIDTFLNS